MTEIAVAVRAAFYAVFEGRDEELRTLALTLLRRLVVVGRKFPRPWNDVGMNGLT
jgi:hypothetical protein